MLDALVFENDLVAAMLVGDGAIGKRDNFVMGKRAIVLLRDGSA